MGLTPPTLSKSGKPLTQKIKFSRVILESLLHSTRGTLFWWTQFLLMMKIPNKKKFKENGPF